MEIGLVLLGLSVSLFFILVVLMFVLAFQNPQDSKKLTRSVRTDLQKIKDQIVSKPKRNNSKSKVYNSSIEDL